MTFGCGVAHSMFTKRVVSCVVKPVLERPVSKKLICILDKVVETIVVKQFNVDVVIGILKILDIAIKDFEVVFKKSVEIYKELAGEVIRIKDKGIKEIIESLPELIDKVGGSYEKLIIMFVQFIKPFQLYFGK